MNRHSPNVKAMVASALTVVALVIGVAIGGAVGRSGSDERSASAASISRAVDGSDRHLYGLADRLRQQAVVGSDQHLYQLAERLGQEAVVGSDHHLYELAEEIAAR
jgi:hypothetical protein